MTEHTWSSWKRFPSAESGNNLEAPVSAGVYEVRNILTGREVTFGASENVADTLSRLKFNSGFFSRFLRMVCGQPMAAHVSDLEYRTLATASRAEADAVAHYLFGRRHAAWRTRGGG
jgi:hypothetical protein